jgi:hypothetical protein
MCESFLKALLHNIFGVFSPAGNALRNEEDPSLVTFDQDLEGSFITALRGGNERYISLSANTVDQADRRFLGLDVVHEFRWHSLAP